MKIIGSIITAVIQIITGYLFLFIGTFIGLGAALNGLGLVSAENPHPWWNTPLTFTLFALTASFGVWIVGWAAAKLRKSNLDTRKAWWRTFAGSAIGVVIVSILYLLFGAVGMLPILIAVVGAMIGYYLKPKTRA